MITAGDLHRDIGVTATQTNRWAPMLRDQPPALGSGNYRKFTPEEALILATLHKINEAWPIQAGIPHELAIELVRQWEDGETMAEVWFGPARLTVVLLPPYTVKTRDEGLPR